MSLLIVILCFTLSKIAVFNLLRNKESSIKIDLKTRAAGERGQQLWHPVGRI